MDTTHMCSTQQLGRYMMQSDVVPVGGIRSLGGHGVEIHFGEHDLAGL